MTRSRWGLALVSAATASPQRLGGSGRLAEVQVYPELSQTHVDGPVTFRQTPPVGGDHNGVWLIAGT